MGSVELVDPLDASRRLLRWTEIDRLGASWLCQDGRMLVVGGLAIADEAGELPAEVLALDLLATDPPRRESACAPRYLQAAVPWTAERWLLAGGLGSSRDGEGLRATDVVEGIELHTGAVQTLASLPFAVAEPLALTLADGRVLVAGGYDEELQRAAAVLAPAGDRWALAPELPTPRAGCAAPIWLDARFVLFVGGWAAFGGAPARDGLVLDTQTLQWQRADVDVPAGAALAAVPGGFLASGGRDSAGEPNGDNTLWGRATAQPPQRLVR